MTHAPLWTIDDHDDDIDEHCDNCGEPTTNITEVHHRWLCPKCVSIHREMIEQGILKVDLDEALSDRFGAPDNYEAPDTLIVNPPFRANLLNQAHDVLDDK